MSKKEDQFWVIMVALIILTFCLYLIIWWSLMCETCDGI